MDRRLAIVEEYADVVESAKDERRPGFQQLLRDLKAPSRSWNHLLLVDTSRLSRRQYMAQVFAHEAKKRGVAIIYSGSRSPSRSSTWWSSACCRSSTSSTRS